MDDLNLKLQKIKQVMNAFAQTRLAHMEHRQIVTQNVQEMQHRHVEEHWLIQFIQLLIFVVKLLLF